jgi:hypothetical protein
MDKDDATEAAPIVSRCCSNLLRTIADKGRTGSDARQQIAQTGVRAYEYLRANTIGPELVDSFSMARDAGATFVAIEQVRVLTAMETPKTLGGMLVQNSLLQLCLMTESQIIVDMTFVSRSDVDAVKDRIKDPFDEQTEQAADDMDQMVFQCLIRLYASVVNHLVTTQRPLPLMLGYQFASPSNTLVISYRLYGGDASRADQVRDENKIIHPAFAPATGQALSE